MKHEIDEERRLMAPGIPLGPRLALGMVSFGESGSRISIRNEVEIQETQSARWARGILWGLVATFIMARLLSYSYLLNTSKNPQHPESEEKRVLQDSSPGSD